MKRKNSTSDPQIFQVAEPAIAYRSGSEHSIHALLGIEAATIEEPLQRVATFRNGFSKKSLDKLKFASGLDYNKLASALAASPKTLQRKDVFDTVQSERMYELAELYSIGFSYFGEEGFRRWMERPLFSIGNRKPLELIDVMEGISILKTEIMRLQHGIAI